MPAQHTPGPYKVERYTKRGEFVTNTCIRSADNSYLAKIGPVNIEANAALFAAAPDLLEALEEATKIIESKIGGCYSVGRNAITKAKAV